MKMSYKNLVMPLAFAALSLPAFGQQKKNTQAAQKIDTVKSTSLPVVPCNHLPRQRVVTMTDSSKKYTMHHSYFAEVGAGASPLLTSKRYSRRGLMTTRAKIGYTKGPDKLNALEVSLNAEAFVGPKMGDKPADYLSRDIRRGDYSDLTQFDGNIFFGFGGHAAIGKNTTFNLVINTGVGFYQYYSRGNTHETKVGFAGGINTGVRHNVNDAVTLWADLNATSGNRENKFDLGLQVGASVNLFKKNFTTQEYGKKRVVMVCDHH